MLGLILDLFRAQARNLVRQDGKREGHWDLQWLQLQFRGLELLIDARLALHLTYIQARVPGLDMLLGLVLVVDFVML